MNLDSRICERVVPWLHTLVIFANAVIASADVVAPTKVN